MAKKKKKFALMVPWMVLGGADRCGLDILDVLSNAGWETITISTKNNKFGNKWAEEFEKSSDRVYDLSEEKKQGMVFERMKKILADEKPDVILINNSHEAYHGIGLLRDFCPDALIMNLVHMHLKGDWDFAGVSSAKEEIDLTLTVSDKMRDLVIEKGKDANAARTLHWFADLEKFRPDSERRRKARKSFKIKDDEFVVLFPARLTPQKRPIMVPEIVRESGVAERLRVIVAGYGNLAPGLRRVVGNMNLDDRFIFLQGTKSDDMPALYDACDLVMMPSEDEGIPIAYYESMAMRVPMLVSDVGAVSELVTEDCGVLVPLDLEDRAAEVKVYGDHLRALSEGTAESKDRIQSMTDTAYHRLTTEFSHEKFRNTVLEIASKRHEGRWKGKAPAVFTKQEPKIFVIGAPKTGTSSVGTALEMLGYRDYKWDWYYQQVYDQGARGPIWELVGHYDSFSDGPFNTGPFYKELLPRYPNAKFICTIRPIQDWLKSHFNHFSLDGDSQVPNHFRLRRYDRMLWARYYQERNKEIRRFFLSKKKVNQLLVFDVFNGDGWEKLCHFLGKPTPKGKKFPHSNKTSIPRKKKSS